MSFSKYIIKHRFLVLISALLLSLLAAWGIKDLEVTVKIENFFVKDDAAMSHHEKFKTLFGQNDFMAILVESDDVFSQKSLEKIYDITKVIREGIPYIDQTISLVDLPGRAGYTFDSNGKLTTPLHIQDSLRQVICADPSILGTLFDKNGKETAISATITLPTGEDAPSEFELGELIYDVTQDITEHNGITITAVAPSVFAFRKKVEMVEDLGRVLAFGGLIAAILCLFVFKNTQSFIGTILLIVLSPAVVFGLLGWLGISVDSTFISVPIMLTMGVSIGNGVHVNHFFRIDAELHHNRREAVIYAISHSWRPILFTAITTICALLSFVFVKVQTIKLVGLISASCVLVMYVLCMTLFPVILSFGRGKVKASPKRSKYQEWFMKLADFTYIHKKSISLAFILFTIVAVWGSTLITIDFNSVDMMGPKLPHMQQQLKIKKSTICSNEFMNLTIIGDKNDFRDKKHLDQLQKLEEAIQQLPLIKKTTSVNKIVAQTHMTLNGGQSEFFKIPEKKGDVYKAYYQLRKHTPRFISKWVTKDYSSTQIFIELSDFSSKIIKDDIDEINQLVLEYFPEAKESFFSGATFQMALMNQYMTRGLVVSVCIALLMITILMMLCFKSFKIGLIAMFPNIFPVLICGATVGFFDIPLEFVTMTVAPLILGLAVDDTIHFISSLKKNITLHKDYEKGITAAYKEVGLAITKTTIILTATFAVFTISGVNSINNMGILSCVGILSAYLADLFIVPVLIRKIKPF